MKNQFFIFCMLLSVFFCSCDDEEGRIKVNDAAPGQVSNVRIEPGPGEVYITWTAPSDASYMYTKIDYVNSKGEEKYKIVAKDKDLQDDFSYRTTVSGFANTDEVQFSLTACSVRGKNKGAVEVKAEPGTPAFALVAETIEIQQGYGGVNVSWENKSAAAVYVALDYYVKSDQSKKGTVKFKVEGGNKGSRFVALTFGNAELAAGELYVINATTQDEEENASEVFSFEKAPLGIEKLTNKSEWSFPGYVDDYGATIGYSSQEAGGEGAAPNGRVIAMIDDNNGTFWHAAWKAPHATTYPHFFILDLGKNTLISNIDIRRRSGNNGTHRGQTIYTCTEEEAGDSNPDNWKWTNHGQSSFNPETDNAQLFGFASAPLTARYIKLYFSASDKGTGNYVMISELNVYKAKE